MSRPNILITGSTGNLGRATTESFISAGYHVIGTVEPGHSYEESENVKYYEVNLSDENSSNDFHEKIRSEYTSLEGVICIAGGFAMSNIETTSIEDLQSQITLNFYTAFNAVKSAYNWMKTIGGGSIVLVSAKPALDGGSTEVIPYSLAKGMVKNFGEILNESGKKDNIVTTVIAPSIIDTKPNRDAMPDANFEDWVSPKAIAENLVFLFSESGKVQRKPVLRLYNKS